MDKSYCQVKDIFGFDTLELSSYLSLFTRSFSFFKNDRFNEIPSVNISISRVNVATVRNKCLIPQDFK